MGKIWIGGVAVLPNMIPFVLYTTKTVAGVQQFGIDIWYVSPNPGQDLALGMAGVDELTGDALADPSASPVDRTVAVFAFLNASGPNSVGGFKLGGWNGVNGIGTDQPSLLSTSEQPWWRPDGSGIVYKQLDNSPNESYIRTCDLDTSTGISSNDTLLLTVSRSTVGNILFPTYSFDGSKIVYGIQRTGNDQIWSMDADGSNNTQIATTIASMECGAAFSLANTQNKVAYTKVNGSNTEIRLVNTDGTGDTLLQSNTTASMLFQLTRRAWTDDDSALLYFKRDNIGTDPEFSMYSVDTGGGGESILSPARTSYGANNDCLAFVFGPRVYWVGSDTFNDGDNTAVMYSCLPDSTGFRTEFDLTNVPAGYDELNWIGGFCGFSNQPT